MENLLKENTRLKEEKAILEKSFLDLYCKMCNKAEADTVFMPCGHIVTCEDCSSLMKKCLICKTEIETSIITHRK